MLGQVQLVGVGPARHEHLSVAVKGEERGDRMSAPEEERHHRPCFQLAGGERTTVDDITRLLIREHYANMPDKHALRQNNRKTTVNLWLGYSIVASALDLRSSGRGFDSRPHVAAGSNPGQVVHTRVPSVSEVTTV